MSPKLAIIKFWGVLHSRESTVYSDYNYYNYFTILIKIKHDILKQCYKNYIKVNFFYSYAKGFWMP